MDVVFLVAPEGHMSETSDLDDRRPISVDDALARLESSISHREPRRVTLDEIVEVIRADREASDR
jgi:hypothetical protein